jgi:hypothetical protein
MKGFADKLGRISKHKHAEFKHVVQEILVWRQQLILVSKVQSRLERLPVIYPKTLKISRGLF